MVAQLQTEQAKLHLVIHQSLEEYESDELANPTLSTFYQWPHGQAQMQTVRLQIPNDSLKQEKLHQVALKLQLLVHRLF